MIGNFQTSKSFNIREGNNAVYDRSQKLPASRLQQWVAYPLISKLNEVTSVLEMSVTNQQGRIKKIIPRKLNNKAICIRFPNLVILNTFLRKLAMQCVSACFETRVPWFFKFNRPIYLNFNMNKRQRSLFNFCVKKFHIECVCDTKK